MMHFVGVLILSTAVTSAKAPAWPSAKELHRPMAYERVDEIRQLIPELGTWWDNEFRTIFFKTGVVKLRGTRPRGLNVAAMSSTPDAC